MKKLILLSSVAIMTASMVQSDETETVQSIKVEKTSSHPSITYGLQSRSVDFTLGSTTENVAAAKGYYANVNVPVGKFFFSIDHGKIVGDISGFDVLMEQTSLGVGVNIFDDLDLFGGTGSRFGVSVSRGYTDMDVYINGGITTEKDYDTYISTQYSLAATDFISLNLGITGPTTDFEPTYQIGASFGPVDLMYSINQEIVDGVTIRASGIKVGLTTYY